MSARGVEAGVASFEVEAEAEGAAVAVAGVADARHRDKVLMLGATAARMAVGLLTFVILARFLGPASFGVVATAMAYSAFAALVSDWGLGVSALREAAARPHDTGAILAEALRLKAVLAMALTAVSAVVAVAVLPASRLPVYAVVHVGALAYSFAELNLVGARALRRFDREAKLVVTGSAMMLLGLGGVTALTRDPLAAAFAFAVTRLLYLALTGWALRDLLRAPAEQRPLLPRLRTRLRTSTSYAVDGILTNLSAQVDLLVFGALLSAQAMGIYQAGARLVGVILPFAAVLSTVYLPTLAAAAAAGDRASFGRNARRLNLEFAGLAAIAGLGFAFVGPVVTHVVYGPRYAALNSLWLGFGVFATLRLLASAYGITLAAAGAIRIRIVSSLVSVGAFFVATIFYLPRYGLNSSSWLLAWSAVPSIIILSSSAEIGMRRRING